jgi:adenylyltransferase/sulfurtransferase
MVHQISMNEVLERRAGGWAPFILDVRSEGEYAQVRIADVNLHVPHPEVLSVLDELPRDTDILLHCKGGMRSQLAANALVAAGWDADRLFNLQGGIMAWSSEAPQDLVN